MRWTLFACGLLALGCQARGPSPEAQAAALEKADEAALALGRTLKSRLQQELPKGPGAAIDLCASEAQPLTQEVAAEQQVKVGRSSLRLRNPKNDGPDWVRQWLEQQGERPAVGVKGLSKIERTPQGLVARVVKPIAVEGACIVCHGQKESIAPEVTAVLSERYPQDTATGYAVGDLRGALWAEAPVGER